MTDEQYEKAQELYKQRDYYKNLANEVEYARKNKARKDAEAKKRLEEASYDHNAKWTLQRFFSVRLRNRDRRTAVIGVQPHWEFAREIEIEADDELITFIHTWLEKKTAKFEEEIKKL